VQLAHEDGAVRGEHGVLALGSYRFDDALGGEPGRERRVIGFDATVTPRVA
jgi:hypothetical protein